MLGVVADVTRIMFVCVAVVAFVDVLRPCIIVIVAHGFFFCTAASVGVGRFFPWVYLTVSACIVVV
jgi:hypothetical protein